MDESQTEMLEALREPQDLATLVEMFDGEEDAATQALETLRALGLLEGVPLDEVANMQAKQLRERARRVRDQRVAETVRWAASRLPLYQERIGELLAKQVHGMSDLVKLPLTTKQDVRESFPGKLIEVGHTLGDLLARREVAMVTTSGSTGGRLEFLYYLGDPAPPVLYKRHPAMLAAGDVSSIRIAQFTTPICSGAVCHRSSPIQERMRDQGRQLPISSSERIMRLRQVELDKILDEIRRFQPDILHADPVYAVALIRALQKQKIAIPRVRGVFCCYEYMSLLHREVMEEAFGVPIHSLYGTSEINDHAAFTCENGRFHVLDERHAFEFLRKRQPVRYGEFGEITVTLLSRPFSRFIRYQTGDLATPIEECGCAFDDLVAFQFEGRVQDVLFTTRGEPVTTRMVDQLFQGLRWIDFYQLLQRDRTRHELVAVPREGTQSESDERIFRERHRELFGTDVTLGIGYVRELPVSPSLKYPPTVNKSQHVWKPND
jgi:phenylacetate-CoA ligase